MNPISPPLTAPTGVPAGTAAVPVVNGDIPLADWAEGMKRSVLREMIAVVSRPGILSFAGGLPAPELFPTTAYAQAAAQVLANDPAVLQYAPPFASLKRHIVRLMARRGVVCAEEQVFLTTGAQQGLDILTRLLVNPGGQVVLEELVYTGIQQALAPLCPDILTVPTDLETGMDVDALENLLAQGARPAYLYAIPQGHNPLGVSLSAAKRERLIQLAHEYHLPILEDDPYGFLSYDGDAPPPLKGMDGRWVFYLGSFSKILAPALRLGWIVAPEALISRLTVVKEANDLESSAFTQRAVAAFLDAGHLPGHIETLRQEYGRRRNLMLAAIEQHFPVEARWTRPSSGMFIWVELPAGTDTAELLNRAIAQEQVAFIPGHAFAVHQSGPQAAHARRCLRLNFSNCHPDKIEDGIARLGRVIRH
jgi:2-aminoadipate transaminase